MTLIKCFNQKTPGRGNFLKNKKMQKSRGGTDRHGFFVIFSCFFNGKRLFAKKSEKNNKKIVFRG